MMKHKGGGLAVGEIKKSSRFLESARMQLAFYLKGLKDRGVDARGELSFPEEKRKDSIILDEETEMELDRIERDILHIIYLDAPPEPKKINYRRNCAYVEFCWA